MQTRWEHFEHGADIGVRGWGASKAEAFEQAALAMMAVITAPEAVQARDTIEIDCEAPDDEMLLVDWLNALIYEMAVRHMLFGRFHVQLNNHHLVAQALGETTSVPRHQPAVEVKGATFTTLSVVQVDRGWLAQTVVDACAMDLAEEAPEAYKDIGAVVDATDAAGLARKVARLEPLICIKG